MTDEAFTVDADQLVKELEVIRRNGVGRPLYGSKTEDDISSLVRAAREISGDPTSPAQKLVTKAIWDAVEKLYPAESRRYAAALLGIDLSKNLDDIEEFPVSPLEGKRRPAAMNLHSAADSSYMRTPNDYERPVLREIADLLLQMWQEARPQERIIEPERTPYAEAKTPPALPTLQAPQEESEHPPPTLLIGAIGVLLLVVGLAWLAAVWAGVIG